ncbi:hypothetical protein [Streptomyces sp. YIM B13518]
MRRSLCARTAGADDPVVAEPDEAHSGRGSASTTTLGFTGNQ